MIYVYIELHLKINSIRKKFVLDSTRFIKHKY